MKVKVKAFAKINLLLDIINRRNDGYHDLFMIMQSVSLCDTVTVTENDSGEITITCNIPDIPLNHKNIAWKAAETFFNYTGIKNRGINIHILKRIPHNAGLAGGSADGAAVITALNRIYETNLNENDLIRIGAEFGADVPFCLTGGTFLAQGVGEVLSKTKPLRRCYIVLAKPDFDVSTAIAFKQYDCFGKTHTPDKLGMLCALHSRDLKQICSKMENVFEQFIEVPKRIEIKEIMKVNGAVGVCMSGSGPTVFGIYENKENAEKAAYELSAVAKDIAVCTPVSKGCKIVEVTE